MNNFKEVIVLCISVFMISFGLKTGYDKITNNSQNKEKSGQFENVLIDKKHISLYEMTPSVGQTTTVRF